MNGDQQQQPQNLPAGQQQQQQQLPPQLQPQQPGVNFVQQMIAALQQHNLANQPQQQQPAAAAAVSVDRNRDQMPFLFYASGFFGADNADGLLNRESYYNRPFDGVEDLTQHLERFRINWVNANLQRNQKEPVASQIVYLVPRDGTEQVNAIMDLLFSFAELAKVAYLVVAVPDRHEETLNAILDVRMDRFDNLVKPLLFEGWPIASGPRVVASTALSISLKLEKANGGQIGGVSRPRQNSNFRDNSRGRGGQRGKRGGGGYRNRANTHF